MPLPNRQGVLDVCICLQRDCLRQRIIKIKKELKRNKRGNKTDRKRKAGRNKTE
jgi:hypothetical protein